METDKFIQKNGILVAIGIIMMIGLAIAVTFIPAFIPIRQFIGNDSVIDWFFGINSVLIVLGTMFFAFYLIWQWIIGINYYNGQIEKQKDKNEKQKQQDQLIKDAEMRKDFEQRRTQINDLIRLIELAKEKLEETKDKTIETEEDAAQKQITKDVAVTKNEKINMDTLGRLIEAYQNLMPKQLPKTS